MRVKKFPIIQTLTLIVSIPLARHITSAVFWLEQAVVETLLHTNARNKKKSFRNYEFMERKFRQPPYLEATMHYCSGPSEVGAKGAHTPQCLADLLVQRASVSSCKAAIDLGRKLYWLK